MTTGMAMGTITRMMAVVGATLVLALVGGPAGAQTVTKTDPPGKAAPAYDVTKVRYSYTAKRVRAVASVPGLGTRGAAQLSVTKSGASKAGYIASVIQKIGGQPRVRLYFFDQAGLSSRPCDGLRGTWANGKVKISIPASCLLKKYAGPVVRTQVAVSVGDDFDVAPPAKHLKRG